MLGRSSTSGLRNSWLSEFSSFGEKDAAILYCCVLNEKLKILVNDCYLGTPSHTISVCLLFSSYKLYVIFF